MSSETPLAVSPSAETANDARSFGHFLAQAREQKRLTLDDLAHLTKIRRAILEALETNARRDLPERVFVLGYVRSYAAAVGLNIEETVNRFQATWTDELPAEGQASGDGRVRSWGWLPPAVAALIAAAVAWFILQNI